MLYFKVEYMLTRLATGDGIYWEFWPQFNDNSNWALVVAQLVKLWLPATEIYSLDPVIGIFIYYQLYLKTEMQKINTKRPEKDHTI